MFLELLQLTRGTKKLKLKYGWSYHSNFLLTSLIATFSTWSATNWSVIWFPLLPHSVIWNKEFHFVPKNSIVRKYQKWKVSIQLLSTRSFRVDTFNTACRFSTYLVFVQLHMKSKMHKLTMMPTSFLFCFILTTSFFRLLLVTHQQARWRAYKSLNKVTRTLSTSYIVLSIHWLSFQKVRAKIN